MSFSEDFIKSARAEFERYKMLGDKTFAQLTEKELHWAHRPSDNSIALIVKHLVGNMRSRWTNFLIEDGEKPWRHRETEFENPYTTKKELLAAWEAGWDCLFSALDAINETNFNTVVRIRNEKHTIIQAVHRQLAHYANHVGQLVFLGKTIKGADWVSLSIPKGGSTAFNRKMFEK